MSDEEKGLPEDEFQFTLPDWMTESQVGYGEAGMLADDEGEFFERHRVDTTGHVVTAVPRRRYIYQKSEWERVSPREFRCKVSIRSAAGEFSADYVGPSVPGARAEIAARATLAALNAAEGGQVALALKGARVLRIFEGPISVVGVYGMNGGTTVLVGACIVDNSVEQATILATLQAADRWLAWQSRQRR